MFTQSEANCTLIKGARGADRCMLGVLAATLSHIRPHAGKTTNIPEGTAIIHSAVPLMTAEELLPQLSSSLSEEEHSQWMEVAVERCGEGLGGEKKRGLPLDYCTLGGFTISDQLDQKSGFRLRGGGREDSGYVVKGYQGICIMALLRRRE